MRAKRTRDVSDLNAATIQSWRTRRARARNPRLTTLYFNEAPMHPDSHRTNWACGLFYMLLVSPLHCIPVRSSIERLCLPCVVFSLLSPHPNNFFDVRGTGCRLDPGSYSKLYSRRNRFANAKPCACTFSGPDYCGPDADWCVVMSCLSLLHVRLLLLNELECV